jgi:hypothetical protein
MLCIGGCNVASLHVRLDVSSRNMKNVARGGEAGGRDITGGGSVRLVNILDG